MLQDLDATLVALVKDKLTALNVTISFAAPDQHFPPTGVTLPAIGFFLYDVRENFDLRTNQWEQEKQANGVFTRKRPPVRVDCSYLVTAWPSTASPNPAQDEHRLLGEVMKALLAYRFIPARYQKGALAGQTPELYSRIMGESQLQSLGEFWQAMGGKPKAALSYGVTISVDVFAAETEGPAIARKDIRLKDKVPAA
ncbi:MAG: DUF4255 domain-containing protein [Gammaproteobacteria bacterium]